MSGDRYRVYHGLKAATSGGLRKKDLVRNRKTGRIVPKGKASAARANPAFKGWRLACKKAAKQLGYPEVPCPLPKKGSAFHQVAMQHYVGSGSYRRPRRRPRR